MTTLTQGIEELAQITRDLANEPDMGPKREKLVMRLFQLRKELGMRSDGSIRVARGVDKY